MDRNIKFYANKIGEFYLNKFDGNYELAREKIVSLHITKLEFDSTANKLRITTARPGILIGKRAENLNKLAQFLEGVHVHVVEDTDALIDHLLPQSVEPDWYDDF